MGRSRIFLSLAQWRPFRLELPSWRETCLSEQSQEKGNAHLAPRAPQGVGYLKGTLIRLGHIFLLFPGTADVIARAKLTQTGAPLRT